MGTRLFTSNSCRKPHAARATDNYNTFVQSFLGHKRRIERYALIAHGQLLLLSPFLPFQRVPPKSVVAAYNHTSREDRCGSRIVPRQCTTVSKPTCRQLCCCR